MDRTFIGDDWHKVEECVKFHNHFRRWKCLFQKGNWVSDEIFHFFKGTRQVDVRWRWDSFDYSTESQPYVKLFTCKDSIHDPSSCVNHKMEPVSIILIIAILIIEYIINDKNS